MKSHLSKALPTSLEVLLNEQPVGTLTHLPHDQSLFSFDEHYIALSNRPVLSLSFKTAEGGLKMEFPVTTTKLLPFFSNLLPEGPLRRYLAERGSVHPDREFFLLWLLGADLPGAVRVRPKTDPPTPAPIQDVPQHWVGKEGPLRFSLAGVQLKFSAILEPTGGLTIPVQGIGGSWIAKLPSAGFLRVPENEFSMMQLAKQVGIEVPEARLIESETIMGLPEEFLSIQTSQDPTLAVSRFDRGKMGQRIHIEDMAQVFERRPEKKYEGVSYGNIAKLLWSEAGETSLVEFVRRLVFNAGIGNADMHLKNWSLIYKDGRTPTLAPAYDLVSTIVYLPDTHLALGISGVKAMKALALDSFQRMAQKADLPQHLVLQTAAETVARFREVWQKEASHLPIDDKTRQQIEKHFGAIPLFKVAGG